MGIAKGIARGLAYLHDDMGITHGHLTARNVLLDEQSQPKISDFGLSFGIMTATAASSNMLSVARDHYRAMKASTKTDVYSLGTIILELLTGKSPSDIDVDLPRWVASVSREEWTIEVFDVELLRNLEHLGPSGDELEGTMTLALQCVDPLPSVRPQARVVLRELERIRPGPENANGKSQHSSPPVQLEVEVRDELEQVRPSPEDGATTTTNENHSPSPRNRAIYTIVVAQQVRRPGIETAEQPEKILLPLEDNAGHSPSVRKRKRAMLYDTKESESSEQPEQDDTRTSENHSVSVRNKAIYTIEVAGQPKRPEPESTEQPEQVRSPQEDGGRTSENPSPSAWNRATVVSEQLRRPGPEPAEEPGQVRSPLEDGAGLSEHQSPLVTTDDQEVPEQIIWSGQEDAQEDAFGQLRQVVSTPEDDTVASEDGSPVVPTETQEVLEQTSSRSEDGASPNGGLLASMQIEGSEESHQPEHIHAGPEDGTRPSNPSSSSMHREHRDVLRLQLLDEHVRSGQDDGARPTADQLPSMQPEQREVLEVEQSRPGPEAGDETSRDLSSALEQREAQAAEQEQLEDPEVVSQQREHVQREADDVSGQSGEGSAAHAHTRPVIFSFFFICFPFLV
jgi:serine/threonine protein kinase